MRYCETCRSAFQSLRMCPRDRTPTRPDLSDPLLGHVLGERYRILERIAAGGMGQVYRAAHTRIASLFAVKVLYGDVAHEPEMRTRFQREGEAASCLQSRHIVRVVDFGETPEDLLYLAMEHLEGVSLSTALVHEPRFAADRAVKVATQIARGLSHAHERGIVHRDLKPGNVMLITEDDEPDVVRLLDFGIARVQHQSGITAMGAIMGTPQYMAPEQFYGGRVDARADLYALGIILYEILTGEPPFDAGNLVEFAGLHGNARPAPFHERGASDVPGELEGICMRLLAKNPDDRFPSARAVIAALRDARLEPATESVATTLRPSAIERSLALPVLGFAASERIHQAIQLGAPAYNTGDHLACFTTYKSCAEELLREGLRPDCAIAAGSRLQLALARAEHASSVTLAAWELRYAFDDLLQATPLRATEFLPTELEAASLVARPRYASGDLDLVGDYFTLFATWLSNVLRTRSGDPAMVTALDRVIDAARRAGGGSAALAYVDQALDALRQGTNNTAVPLPQVTHRLLLICPRAAEFAERITQAIALGAPAFNLGRVDACYRIYRQTAVQIVNAIGDDQGCNQISTLLGAAIDSASRLEPSQASWTLRHAFDAVLNEVRAELTGAHATQA